ncbi:MAG: transcription termination factor Rho [Planctomycetota bacterium]
MSEGFGFLRFADHYYRPHDGDVHVAASLIRKFDIRPGSMVKGDVAAPAKRGQKPTLVQVQTINGKDPELHRVEMPFKDLTACDPDERLILEVEGEPDPSMRIIDLLTPIGRGQRALIVAPPRTGKTVIMQKMANAIAHNHPEIVIIVLLIDERPEEVTDMKRNTKAEVIASCLDEGTANHVRVTESVLVKVKRLVEAGVDVVCLLDSITRLGRAYNNETKHSGRILSGGVDAKTLAKPKAFFGAARNIENGGSLTIIATALIDTGSRMDQVIFEEFKGTGNMELVLSRQLANNRTYPAIDVASSGTRKEEKLFDADDHKKINVLRRVLNQLPPTEAMRLLIERMEKTGSNAEFLSSFDPAG